MFGRTTGKRSMAFHTTSMTIILMGLRMNIVYILSIFLFHLGIISLMVV